MRETNLLTETKVLNCQQLSIRHAHQINCCRPRCLWLRSKDTCTGLKRLLVMVKNEFKGIFDILWRYTGVSVNSMSENANLCIIRES